MTPVRVGWVLALLATFCFSVAPPIARAAIVGGLNPTAILVVRMTITLALLVVTVVASDRTLLRAEGRTVRIAFGAGLINSLGMMGYFWALSLLDASVASMLFAVSPLFTLALLALGGERITRRNLLRMLLALSGVYLLIGPGGDVNLTGVLLVGVSVVAFGLQVVLIQWYLRGYDARTITLYMIAGMWMGLTFFWMVQGMPWEPPGAKGWATILVLAVVSTYLARLAFFGAVARVGGAQVAMLTPLEILLTVVWSILFLGERLTPVQWLGGVLILASAALAIEMLGRFPTRLRWRLWGKM